MTDVYALVRSIRDKRLPRNRFFAEHATTNGAAARRLHRFLSGIKRDLLSAEIVEVVHDETVPRWRVTMRFPSVRLHRVVWINADEHAILVEDPRVAERLSAS